MPSTIKSYYCRRKLRKLLLRERTRELKEYDDIKSVMLLFVMNDEGTWTAVNRCAQQLEEAGKHVEMMGMVPKTLKQNFVVMRQSTLLLHEKKQFSWLGIPKGEEVNAMLGRHYDLVIDLTGTPTFFAQYVAVTANASLRAAYCNTTEPLVENSTTLPTTSVYDFIISGDGPIDIAHYIVHMVENLKMITQK